MSSEYYIDDSWKSDYTDFDTQKDLGLAYIQKHGTNDWTNLNASDPGVTILDQVCYALTELGYCNQFPMKDILTKSDGTLKVNNQFYLPNEILTISPVTVDDYRRYVLDSVDGLYNVVIIPNPNYGIHQLNMYDVLLYPSPDLSEDALNHLPDTVFNVLNNARNLNEFFTKPVNLIKQPVQINGTITIQNENDLNTVLYQIQRDVQQYIFPEVTPVTFGAWQELPTDAVYDGPELQNGWIDPDSLGSKLDTILSMDIASIMQSVENVISVKDLSFNVDYLPPTPISVEKANMVTVDPDRLIYLDFLGSIANKNLKFFCNGKNLFPKAVYLELSSPDGFVGNQTNAVLELSDSTEPTYPTGTYRDINSFYSIQNTFPEIFGIGDNPVSENATDLQIAQTRQLKGYLTLFDQVLANQFSQLANLDKLFSFKNSSTGTPSDFEAFKAAQDVLEKQTYRALPDSAEDYTPPSALSVDSGKSHLLAPTQYPVPYLRFSPTYFYQSVYDTPHIRPLLRGFDTLDFSRTYESSKEAEKQSWTDYKLDPYNPYIHGLMGIMESEETSIYRRNEQLNFVLAMNGESPYTIEAIINGSVYSGNSLKDQVIFKSLYLQNFGVLSYNRLKAYNYLAANKISSTVPEIPEKLDQRIFGGNSVDFVFNSAKIDAIEKLNAQDFINYSAVELKLFLLFGLRVLYRNFIADRKFTREPLGMPSILKKRNQALWLIEQRKGVFFIETGLLAKSLGDDIKDDSWIFDYDALFIFPDYIKSSKDFISENSVFETPEFETRFELFTEVSLPPHIESTQLLASSEKVAALILVYTFWHNSLIHNYSLFNTEEKIDDLIEYIMLQPIKEAYAIILQLLKLKKYIKDHEGEYDAILQQIWAVLLIQILTTLQKPNYE